jgi:hypothetical protein
MIANAGNSEWIKRVVVPSLLDTPQKRDGRPSLEQVNSLDGDVLEAYSSISCARRRRNGENSCYWICGVSKRSNRRKSSLVYRKTEGGRGRVRQEMKRLAARRERPFRRNSSNEYKLSWRNSRNEYQLSCL